MIVVLTGSNNFALRQTLKKLIADHGGEAERFEASDLETPQLVDLLQGQSMFSVNRLIIVDGASQQKSLWSGLKDILPKTSDDTTLILVETAPDKRTATYKLLQKNAQVIDHSWWKGGETGAAEKWLMSFAEQNQLEMPRDLAREMVSRATRAGDDGKAIIDQQQLANAVLQLSNLSGEVTNDHLDAVLAPGTHENIFELLAAALRRETTVVQTMVDNLSQTEDGHRAMGLLVSQLTNLTALTLADDARSIDQVAADIGAHPFALRQLVRFARQLSKSELTSIVQAIADADEQLKRSQADPWLLIRNALLTISRK